MENNFLKNISRERERESNIELLRIILMFFMIAHHYIVNSGITQLYNYDNITCNMLFSEFYPMFGKTIINVFTIITGYYMIEKNITYKKIFKLFFTTIFYTYFFNILFLLTGYDKISLHNVLRLLLFLPIEFNHGYTSTMLVFLLFIPYINILVKKLDIHKLRFIILLFVIIFSIVPTILPTHHVFDLFFWLIICYIIGAYIHLYINNTKLTCGILCTIISLIFMIFSIIVLNNFNSFRIFFGSPMYFTGDANKFTCLVLAFGIFIIFKNIKIKYNKYINIIAQATFGVLVIHSNSATMRKLLWVDIFKVTKYYNNNFYIIYSIFVVFSLYAICVIIELLKIRFIESKIFNNKKLLNLLNKNIGE